MHTQPNRSVCILLLPSTVCTVHSSVFIEYYTVSAPMFVSCSTTDHSLWCAQLAYRQSHHDIELIEEWVSPLFYFP